MAPCDLACGISGALPHAGSGGLPCSRRQSSAAPPINATIRAMMPEKFIGFSQSGWPDCRAVSWLGSLPKRCAGKMLLRGLIKCCAACIAQARSLTAQACGDRAHIGDLAGTKAIDVGGAGPALLGRTLVLGKCRAA